MSGECVEKARIIRAEGKKDFATKRAKDVFERLLSAAARLRRVAESLKGSSNKELAKFTDQINNLCDKYEK